MFDSYKRPKKVTKSLFDIFQGSKELYIRNVFDKYNINDYDNNDNNNNNNNNPTAHQKPRWVMI